MATTQVSNTNPTSTSTSATTSAQTTSATSTNVGDVKNGPLAKAGQDLITLYTDYQGSVQSGSSGTFTSRETAIIQVVGNQVRVDIRGSVDVNTLASTMSSLGMQVESTDARTHTVEGLISISQLPTVAQSAQVATISPVYKARLF